MCPTLSLTLKPEWDEIDGAREQATTFLEGQALSRDVADAAIMVTSELLENAVKYGAADAEPGIDLHLALGAAELTVMVTNRVCDDDLERLERLDRTIQWIRGFQNPFQPYLERLREVSTQSLKTRDSGLGLLRIAYEGQATLDFFVDERETLAISAVSSRHDDHGEDSA